MVEVNREELAWAAGFFDGEGSFICTNTLRLALGQSGDSGRKLLERLRKTLFGLGHISGPRNYFKTPAQPFWEYRVNGFEAVQVVGCALWNWLGSQKRNQFVAVVEEYHTAPKVRRYRKLRRDCGVPE